MATYQYKPVDSANSEIRLLTIHRDIKQVLGRANVGQLSGTLSNNYLPVSTLPRATRLLRSGRLPIFYALSYVWGEASKHHQIWLDGKPLTITDNLYEALRAIQKSSAADIRVWADAICVNQEDTLERSAQILLMRDIYHSAFVVRIWLGPSSPDATQCLEFIDKLTGAYISTDDPQNTGDAPAQEALVGAWLGLGEGLANTMFRIGQTANEIGDVIKPVTRDSDAEMLQNPDEDYSLYQESIHAYSKWRPSARRLAKAQKVGDFTAVASLISQVFTYHDWFTRMWVVQEVGAADDVEVQIGGIAVGWRYLVRTIYYLHFTRQIPINNISRLTGLEKIRLGWNEGKRQPLRHLIRECRYRKATDPRDKIFALLGLMGDRIDSLLSPDYTKSIGEVYANATRHFIMQTQSLDIICGWERREPHGHAEWSLPSWAPYYSLDQDHASSSLTPTDGRECIYAASGFDHRSKYFPQPYGGMGPWNQLTASGIVIDSISILSPLSSTTLITEAVILWNQTLSSASQILSCPIDEVIQKSLDYVSEVVSTYEHQAMSPEADRNITVNCTHPILEPYLNTLVSGRMSSRKRASTADIAQVVESKSGDVTSDQDQRRRNRDALQAGMLRRRLAITKAGRIGSVPISARENDCLCVLYGCSVPVVLRLENNTYKFVGESYVHGFMDAEAIALSITGSLKAESFTIT